MLQVALNRLPIHYRTAVTLFDIESQAELDAVRATMPKADGPVRAPSTPPPIDPDADLP